MIRVVLLLALTVQCASSAGCQLGWRGFKGYCYAFQDEYVTWFTAASACDTLGARLVHIDSQAKNDWIVSQLVKKVGSYWIGGTDKLHEGTWEWIPSFRRITNYQNWAPNEPNNNEKNENCLELREENDYKWNDVLCTLAKRFVCEKKLLAADVTE